jgi:tRNA dimethylallyltransferase
MAPAARRSPPPIAAIVGPTASGKTDLALALAARRPLEVLAADSRQVYRGMDVATAKPDAAARAAVPHHLLDVADPAERFTVADWLRLARPLLPAVAARGRLPLVVGGTGLYVSALIDGWTLGGPGSAAARERLAAELEDDGLLTLAERLAQLDREAAARTDLRNPRRVLRALERHAAGTLGPPLSEPYGGPVAMIGVRRPRAVLAERIAARARAIFDGGLLDEVQRLEAAGVPDDAAPLTGHGYREAREVLAGRMSIDQALELTIRHTRQYAKRQETWFRRDARIEWLDLDAGPADDPGLVAEVDARLDSWLADQS